MNCQYETMVKSILLYPGYSTRWKNMGTEINLSLGLFPYCTRSILDDFQPRTLLRPSTIFPRARDSSLAPESPGHFSRTVGEIVPG